MVLLVKVSGIVGWVGKGWVGKGWVGEGWFGVGLLCSSSSSCHHGLGRTMVAEALVVRVGQACLPCPVDPHCLHSCLYVQGPVQPSLELYLPHLPSAGA